MAKEIVNGIGLVLLVLGLAAFWLYARSERDDESKQLVLEAYEVPAGRAEEIARVLSGALPRAEAVPAGSAAATVAKVTASPDGRVLVAGSRAMQRAIAKVIAETAGRPAAAPPPSVDTTFWVVRAKRIGASGAKSSTDGNLTEVATVLDTISASDGAMEFSLLEKVRLVSMSDERAEGRGDRVKQFSVRPTVTGGKVIADVFIDPDGSAEFQTRVQLAPDQFLVLGESAFPEQKDERLYYVVRPSIRG